MKTYKFENVIFTWGEPESNVLNGIFNKNKKDGVVIKFKECKINHIGFTLLKSIKTKIYFDDCTFFDASIRFVFGSSHTVVFKNCKFEPTFNRGPWNADNFPLRIVGDIGPKSILKFENCTGLTKDYFTSNSFVDGNKGDCGLHVTNSKCTLSYMGLYRTFKDRILNKSKEEVVYKKVAVFRPESAEVSECDHIGYAIATLVIPKGVVRYGNKHGKCRCQYAIVREIEPLPACKDNGWTDKCVYSSIYDPKVEYKVGKTITPNAFDTMPGECSSGIHYFYDIKDAMEF